MQNDEDGLWQIIDYLPDGMDVDPYRLIYSK